jgi:hypothetical protein
MKVPRLVVTCAAVALLAPATAAAATQEEIDLFGHAAGLDVQRLSESTNLVAQIAAAYNHGCELDGSVGNGATNVNAFTALALARVGAPGGVLAKANGYLRGQQHLDGGWGVGRVSTDAQRAAAASVDMTGVALAALCETGAAANDPEVRAGLSFLEGRQDPATGGFGNVDSTGWARSGLNACGVAPQGGRFTTSASRTPVDYLLSQQDPGGAFLFLRRAEPVLDPERRASPGRRGLVGRPAAPRHRGRPALPGRAGRRLARHVPRRRPLRHVVRHLGWGRQHDRRPPRRLAAAPQPHVRAARVGDTRHRVRRHGRPPRVRLDRRRPRPVRIARTGHLHRALAPPRHVPREEQRGRPASCPSLCAEARDHDERTRPPFEDRIGEAILLGGRRARQEDGVGRAELEALRLERLVRIRRGQLHLPVVPRNGSASAGSHHGPAGDRRVAQRQRRQRGVDAARRSVLGSQARWSPTRSIQGAPAP